MIRALLGSAFPVVGLALATVFTGPDLVTGVSGAPMIVSSEERAILAAAEFEGEACASTLLLGEARRAEQRPSIRIVAMALRPDGQDIELGIRDIPGPSGAPTETVVFLFDETGRLISIGKPAATAPPTAAHPCPEAPKHTDAPV
jgi:hypothetical protein